MILGHKQILKYLEKKPPLVENVDKKHVQGAGIDLRVKNIFIPKGETLLGVSKRVLPEILEVKDDRHELGPGEYVLVETVEKVNMPSDVLGLMQNRSSLFRCGASLRTAVIDPGYVGTLTFGLRNERREKFVLEKGARVGQIVFFLIEGETRLYDGRYQGGNVV